MGIQFEVKSGNPQQVNYITGAKYAFFSISLLSILIYYRKLRQVPDRVRVVEQTLVLRQGILLVFLNDPFYAMIFYSPNRFHIVFISVTVVAYYCHLIYYWLVVFERIYVENNQKSNNTGQLWKRVLVLVEVWLLGALRGRGV